MLAAARILLKASWPWRRRLLHKILRRAGKKLLNHRLCELPSLLRGKACFLKPHSKPKEAPETGIRPPAPCGFTSARSQSADDASPAGNVRTRLLGSLGSRRRERYCCTGPPPQTPRPPSEQMDQRNRSRLRYRDIEAAAKFTRCGRSAQAPAVKSRAPLLFQRRASTWAEMQHKNFRWKNRDLCNAVAEWEGFEPSVRLFNRTTV